MRKFKTNEFVFNMNNECIEKIEVFVKQYKIQDDKDIEDLNDLIRHKKSLIEIQQKLAEQLQILAEEEK